MDYVAIAVVQALAVSVCLFALSSGARRWLQLEPWRALIAGLVLLGGAGVVMFAATFADVTLALPFRLLFGAIVLALIGWSIIERSAGDRELITPCALVFAASVIVLYWAFQDGAPDRFEHPLRHMMFRWRDAPLASDNEIPWLFAQELRQAQITSPMMGDWLSSDRPPLQTGLYLLLNLGGEHRLWYQACATALQMTALAMVWSIARAMGADRKAAFVVACAALATPVIITNAAYVWPKLLGTAFVCATFALHFYGAKDHPWRNGVLAGAAAALAMLAHGTSAFPLLGIAIAALALWRIGSWRYVLAGAVTAAALFAPWMAYQRLYDPPGDRLLKWHLAGAVRVNERPLAEVISGAYDRLTWESWADARARNIGRIVGADVDDDEPSPALSRPVIWEAASSSVAIGMGLFALALWAAPAMLFAKAARAPTAAAIASLLIWSLLIFAPGQTLAKHGSFFPQLALVISAGALLWSTPRRRIVGAALVLVQAVLVGALYA